jgi:hypothetical protein
MRSRNVLEDCKRALEDFEAAGPTPYWQTRWVGMVALLRAVGHVLKEIDAKQSPKWKKAVDDAWARLKKTEPEPPAIFWKFIEEERNNVLKAYAVGARLNIGIQPGSGNPPQYESFMRTGFYDGRAALTLCREAIAFWEKHLAEVEAAATQDP